MILATGAAVSPNLHQLVSKTRFLYRLICIDEVGDKLKHSLSSLSNGLWAIDSDLQAHDLNIPSAFLLNKAGEELFRHGHTFFVSGAVTDRLLKTMASKPSISDTLLIVRDFTKLFITQEAFADYTRKGGRIQVLQQSKLLAVTLNPTSPQGYTIDSDTACNALSDALQIPVYDVMVTSKHSTQP